MEQQHVANHSNARNVSQVKHDPTQDFDFNLGTAAKAGDFASWARLFARTWNTFNLPSQQLYELVQRCPTSFHDSDRDLRLELLERYRDELLSILRNDNIISKVRKFMTLLQLANFVGRAQYLSARALTIAAFHEANAALPNEVKERIAACEKWNERNGRYTEAELLQAGYTVSEEDSHRKIFLNPLSRESLTVYAKDELSEEDRAKIRALRDSKREARRQERSKNPNKGTSTPKAEKASKKKK